MKRIYILLLVVFMSLAIKGQLTRPGIPIPLHELKDPKIYQFSVSEQQKMKSRVSEDPLLKPAGSGMLIPASFSPDSSGTWDTLADGTFVWRIGIRVQEASIISLVLEPFHVKPGVRLYMYDPTQQNVLGAFSDLNNKSINMLATGFIPGETVILEAQIPSYAREGTSLGISGIGCDFSAHNQPKEFKDGWFGLSGDCNMDINCEDQPSYQVIKNAVVRIVFLGDERCTGTLLNNVLNDGRNYVLTAGHCIHTESVAHAAVFYFSYESPYCDGPDGSNSHSVSGATLRAYVPNLDFVLLELLEKPPVNYHAYYAGWDNSGKTPAAVYAIHHPLGDVKKISFDNDPPVISSFGKNFDINTHWLINRWDIGTTEAGSSGGGLFNAENRLIGTLTGGEAVCGNPVNDYFQMFSHDWKDYPAGENQLAFWLDATNTRSKTLNGYDPNAAFWSSGDTLSHFEAIEMPDTSGLEWGSWSGHNSMNLTGFARKFTTHKKKMMGLLLHVAGNYVASSGSSLAVTVWNDESGPGEVMYEKTIPLANLTPYTHDQFIEFDSIISIADTFYAGYRIFYDVPADTFSTYMAASGDDSLQYSSWVFNHVWMTLAEASSGKVKSSFTFMPVVFDSLTELSEPEFTVEMALYPNPADQFVRIVFRKLISTSLKIDIFNIQGQLVASQDYGMYQQSVTFETSALQPGIYIVKASYENTGSVARMLILR